MFHCGFYNVVSENHSVQNASPPGRWVYAPAQGLIPLQTNILKLLKTSLDIVSQK